MNGPIYPIKPRPPVHDYQRFEIYDDRRGPSRSIWIVCGLWHNKPQPHCVMYGVGVGTGMTDAQCVEIMEKHVANHAANRGQHNELHGVGYRHARFTYKIESSLDGDRLSLRCLTGPCYRDPLADFACKSISHAVDTIQSHQIHMHGLIIDPLLDLLDGPRQENAA